MSARPLIRYSFAGVAVAAMLSGCTVVPPGQTAAPAATESLAPDASVSPGDSVTPDESAAPEDSASPDASPSESASADPSASASPDASASASPDASASPEPSASPSAGAQGPTLLEVTPGQQTPLTVANAFRTDGWAEDQFQAPGGQPATAMGAFITCGQPAPELEYRLANGRGTVRMSVAQDIMSDSADNTIEFVLLADGKQVANRPVTFKQKADLTASLNGVTVLKVQARPRGKCTDATTAIITKAFVQG
ncbi:hypothetical protein [Nigerium massiliense]|uniref:hypothetical protein n=1 Tax=Nigerium massiliense TaxID=1522317 RepID=UPI0006949E17|nr:hypothetical protein [Nigerium massiliense]